MKGALFAVPLGVLALLAVPPPTQAHWQNVAAMMGPAAGMEPQSDQRDVIEPPSSVDPGMALDPPQTGARMPVIRPPAAAPSGRPILPR